MSGTITADIVVIGAGMAGVGVAAGIAADHRVAIVEMEPQPAYHTTGRSAAIFIQNYGNAAIRALNRFSAGWFADADLSLFPNPLLTPRGCLFVADENGLDHHRRLMAEDDGLIEVTPDKAVALVPFLKREPIIAASYEPDARDIDVASLHQGWLKQARRAGAQVMTGAAVTGATRRDGVWRMEAGAQTLEAPVVVNAAGAWADLVASLFGISPIGLTPFRRSMAVLPQPDGLDCNRFPMVGDAAERWYCKPDGGRLFVSPADEDPMEPHDAFADDMVLAEGLDRFQQAVTFPVARVERSWAGLRTFAPDRTPVVGFEPDAEGFFWLVGQGGYGIQTSPGLSLLAASLIRRAASPAGLADVVQALAPDRFRKQEEDDIT